MLAITSGKEIHRGNAEELIEGDSSGTDQEFFSRTVDLVKGRNARQSCRTVSRFHFQSNQLFALAQHKVNFL